MLTLLGGIALLILGYFTYGRYIEKNFSIDPERTTPAEALKDGYDFVPMSKSKNAIIELLNIAGTGPIFGPITGSALRSGRLHLDHRRLHLWRSRPRLHGRDDFLAEQRRPLAGVGQQISGQNRSSTSSTSSPCCC